MAEDQVATRKEGQRDYPLWTRIFNTFRVALDPKKLLLAAAGIVVMAAGWWFFSWIFFSSRGVPHRADYVVTTDSKEASAQQEAREKSQKAYDAAYRRYRLLAQTAGPGTWLPYEPVDKNGNVLPTQYEYVSSGRLRTWPWVEDRGPNPVLLAESLMPGGAAQQPSAEDTLGAQRPEYLVLLEPLIKFLEPIYYLFHPNAGFWNRTYFVLVILWTLITWAFFGAAITRMAVVQYARNEKIGMMEALRFTWSRYLSFLFAPLFPLILLAFLTLLLLVYWFFGVITVFFGDIVIAGLFWPLVILFGLVMALTLVGLVGWPLMYATISAEGSDSFDALSRSYSYVYQAPWHYLWYSLVAVAYGVVVVFFVGFMGSLLVYLGKWGTSQAPLASKMDREPSYLFIWAPTSFGWRDLFLDGTEAVYSPEQARAKPVNPQLAAMGIDVIGVDAQLAAIQKRLAAGTYPKGQAETLMKDADTLMAMRPGSLRPEYLDTFHFWNYIGAALVAFWVGLIFLLVVGFGYSYFWCASSIIYLLMRRKVDETDLDEVHLEEDELEEPYVPPAPATGAAKPPAGDANLIPPESLTLRTPAGGTPANEPVPGATKEVVTEPAKAETTQVVSPPPPPETAPASPPPPSEGDGNRPV